MQKITLNNGQTLSLDNNLKQAVADFVTMQTGLNVGQGQGQGKGKGLGLNIAPGQANGQGQGVSGVSTTPPQNNAQVLMNTSLGKTEAQNSQVVIVKLVGAGDFSQAGVSNNLTSVTNNLTQNHTNSVNTTNNSNNHFLNVAGPNSAQQMVFIPPQNVQQQPPQQIVQQSPNHQFFVTQQPVQQPVVSTPVQTQLPPAQVTTAAPPPASIVSSITNLLAGSAADVFTKAGVISITEPTKASITFENEHAAFKNSLVMYKLDPSGMVKDVQALFPNASALGSGGNLKDGLSSVDVNLNAGDQVGFALLPNGFSNLQSREALTRDDGQLALFNWKKEPANLFQDPAESLQLVHIDKWGNLTDISGQFGNKMLFSVGNAEKGITPNVDGRVHADQIVDPNRGLILIGMNDQFGNSDFKNLIFSMHVGETNATALNENLIDDRPRTFRELAGADMMASREEIMTAARMFDKDGDGRLNEKEWAEFAPLLNLTPEDHKHFVGLRGRGDLDSLSLMISRGDVNGNGMLDEREVLELGRRLNGNNPNVIQSFREAAGIDWKLSFEEFVSTAEAHDKDDNGLDQQEWNRFAPVLGLTPQDRNLFLDHKGKFDIEKFMTIFSLADTNGDGQLEPREVLELRRLVHEHFAPKDFPQEW